MDNLQKRTWAEISLDNIEHNYKTMRARLPDGTRFLGVVKANAYGHGACETANLLQKIGCDYLAVDSIDEGVLLRGQGIIIPMLIFGYTDPVYARELIKYGLTQMVDSVEAAHELAHRAAGGQVKVHIKVDSGMGRLGFICRGDRNPREEILSLMVTPGLDIEGIFTHFAASDIQGEAFTREQFNQFIKLVQELERDSGKKFKIKHCSNSGAMVNYDWTYLDMVRPGISLYGVYPEDSGREMELRPAMELKTRVVSIKELREGDTVSYGRIYTAPSARTIAVIGIGYADGLHRVLSGKMDVIVNGQRVPQIGRICMDMCMIDITDIQDVKVGDVVTVFGRDGDVFIPVEEQAERAGTISYELLCAVSPRVPRVYIDGSSCEYTSESTVSGT